ncbi:MAG: HAD family hydrolase [Spirochaetales bacterium]|nr:HAD family hydrolase [Spirochaetales bacterium]
MNTQNIEALIFDLDGTLYDKKNIVLNTLKSHWREIPILHASNRLRKALKGVDLESSEKFHETFYSRIAGTAGRRKATIEHWYQKKFYPRFIRALKKKYRARNNLIPTLEKLQRILPMAVFSDYSYVPERLHALKIPKEYFSFMAGSEEYGVLKPSARPLLEIAAKLGVSPEKVLVVGDRDDTDGEAARMAGMMFYHIAGPEHWDRFIEDMLQLTEERGQNG